MRTTNDSARLAATLQELFRLQAIDALRRVDLYSDSAPDLSHWVDITARATKPILSGLWRQGMLRSATVIASQAIRPSESGRDGMRTYRPGNESAFGPSKAMAVMAAKNYGHGWPTVKKSKRKNEIKIGFDAFNPRVGDAVDNAVLQFCRETNQTAVEDLGKALADLRKLLKEGLSRGEAYSLLAKKIREIFADPKRAFRIAVTETQRAINGGLVLAAKESNLRIKKYWIASVDACEKCFELSMMDPIELDTAFIVLPGGGPYAVVQHPPLHPRCMCSLGEEVQE